MYREPEKSTTAGSSGGRRIISRCLVLQTAVDDTYSSLTLCNLTVIINCGGLTPIRWQRQRNLAARLNGGVRQIKPEPYLLHTPRWKFGRTDSVIVVKVYDVEVDIFASSDNGDFSKICVLNFCTINLRAEWIRTRRICDGKRCL